MRPAATAALALAFAAGCAAPAAPPRVDNTVPTATSRGRSARDFERGVDGPRDYTRAVAGHRIACAEGRGDLEACDQLLLAISEARGIERSIPVALAVVGPICKRGDDVACGYRELLLARSTPPGRENPRPPPDRALFDRIETACQRGDARACRFTLGMIGGDGSSAEERRDHAAELACRAGDVSSCSRLTMELTFCSDDDDPGACEQHKVAEWRSHPYDARTLAAYQQLTALCDAGEASACEDLAGRAIPDEELCAARDYGACAAIACFGDDAAAALARAHGGSASCNLVRARAMARWRASNDNRPPPVAADDPSHYLYLEATGPFDAVADGHHGGRDRMGWPRYDLQNLGDQRVIEIAVCLYAYDADGKQLARIRQVIREPIPAKGKLLVHLDHAGTAAPLPRTAVDDQLVYDRIRFAGAPASEDTTRCPPQLPPPSP